MFGSIHANHVDQSGLEVYNIIFTSYRCGIYIYMWYIYIYYTPMQKVSVGFYRYVYVQNN